jgi:hypothetical protein
LDGSRPRCGDHEVLERHHAELPPYRVEQLTWGEQELGATRSPVAFVAGCECLVDERATWGDNRYQILETGTMQVVDDDHRPEPSVRERKGPPVLEIDLEGLETRIIPQVADPGEVTIDGDDAVAPSQEQPSVPAAAARDVEHG